MYVPKKFEVNDWAEIASFIEKNGFGTVVVTENERPIAAHLPLLLEERDGAYFVTGHVARGNPAWRAMENEEDVFIMFQGPHAYVSSSWYAEEKVPTWNYQAVHLYGTGRLLEGYELRKDLVKLLEKYEGEREHPVLWETLSADLLDGEMKGIVGFEVRVNEVEAAYKLSQNRKKADYENIIRELRKENDPAAAKIADEMERIQSE